MIDDSIVVKIQKCLALATSSNLNEAAAAMEAAQRLMTKHNIKLYEVEQRTGKRTEEITRNDFDLGVGRGAPANWLRSLVFSIARQNFCRALAWNGQRKMTIVGEPHNIEIVKHFYAYLSKTIDDLAEPAYRESEAAEVYPKMRALGHTDAWYWSSRSWKNAFRVKAVETIDARLWLLRKSLDTETTALVVTKEQQVKDKVAELFPKLGKSQGSEIYNYEGANAGVKAGKAIPLSMPVGGSQPTSGALR